LIVSDDKPVPVGVVSGSANTRNETFMYLSAAIPLMHNKSAEVSIRIGNTIYASVPVQLQRHYTLSMALHGLGEHTVHLRNHRLAPLKGHNAHGIPRQMARSASQPTLNPQRALHLRRRCLNVSPFSGFGCPVPVQKLILPRNPVASDRDNREPRFLTDHWSLQDMCAAGAIAGKGVMETSADSYLSNHDRRLVNSLSPTPKYLPTRFSLHLAEALEDAEPHGQDEAIFLALQGVGYPEEPNEPWV
jgi:hypothetical protein